MTLSPQHQCPFQVKVWSWPTSNALLSMSELRLPTALSSISQTERSFAFIPHTYSPPSPSPPPHTHIMTLSPTSVSFPGDCLILTYFSLSVEHSRITSTYCIQAPFLGDLKSFCNQTTHIHIHHDIVSAVQVLFANVDLISRCVTQKEITSQTD